ncbi:MAG: L,D-transpeptidase family protein [Rhodovarius sp.]|nr:L,D-transpeptidase family protein [Rhodovarius sp.]
MSSAEEAATALISPEGLLRFRGRVLRCALGRGGIRADKREGDGATPAGLWRLERILWRADRGPRPQAPLPAEPIAPADGWCDDPLHPDYNRPVVLPHPARCERLWRDDHVYDVIVLTDWNSRPIRPGRGSAIFLHVARPGLPPTEGCIALPEGDLRALLGEGLRALRVLAPGERG